MKKIVAMNLYREFMMTVNLSNKLFVVPNHEGYYRAYIGKGNNGNLIKSLLKTRSWWSIRNRGEI